MQAFANVNGNLTVLLGTVVYELATKSADQAHSFAVRAANDALMADALTMACRGAVRVGNRQELEARDDRALQVYNGPHAIGAPQRAGRARK